MSNRHLADIVVHDTTDVTRADERPEHLTGSHCFRHLTTDVMATLGATEFNSERIRPGLFLLGLGQAFGCADLAADEVEIE